MEWKIKIRKYNIHSCKVFNLFWSKNNLTPDIKTYWINDKKEEDYYNTSEDEVENENQYLSKEQPKDKPYVNYKCVIIYKGETILCKSYGNTKEQAKKNACLLGFAKIMQELKDEGKIDPSSDEYTNTYDFNEESDIPASKKLSDIAGCEDGEEGEEYELEEEEDEDEKIEE